MPTGDLTKTQAMHGPGTSSGARPIPAFKVTEKQGVVELAAITMTYGDKGYDQKAGIAVPKERLVDPVASGQNSNQK